MRARTAASSSPDACGAGTAGLGAVFGAAFGVPFGGAAWASVERRAIKNKVSFMGRDYGRAARTRAI